MCEHRFETAYCLQSGQFQPISLNHGWRLPCVKFVDVRLTSTNCQNLWIEKDYKINPIFK